MSLSTGAGIIEHINKCLVLPQGYHKNITDQNNTIGFGDLLQHDEVSPNVTEDQYIDLVGNFLQCVVGVITSFC